MMKDKKDMRPLLLKLGVALALSFAGILYSRFRTKKIRPAPSSSEESRIDAGGRGNHKDEVRSNPTTPTSIDTASVPPENHEEASPHKVNIDYLAVGFASSQKHSGDEGGFLLPEFNNLVITELEVPSTTTGVSPRKIVETPTSLRRAAESETEQEIINLRNMVRVLRERERKLEIQLLEYYGLKEQETAVMELQNRLKINNVEAKLFNLKIESLQADNQRLEAKVADYTKVMAELESARMKIKLLKRKIRSDGEQTKEQLSTLQQKVASLQDQELNAVGSNEDIQTNLNRLKELEEEAAELRMSNSRLQNENSELARRLESTQILATSVLELPEAKALQEDNNHLRQENDDLTNQVERLQASHSADVEELVYLRWVNACLRYELRNYEAPPGKTVARDLSKSLSPRSEEKAKRLILEYANSEGMGDKGVSLMDFDSEYWSSSQDSSITESAEFDDSSLDIPSTARTNNSSKLKFLNKLRKLVRGKDSQKSNQSSAVDNSTTTSFSASGRRESGSTGSYEDLVRAYGGSVSSHHSSTMSSKDLMAIEARAEERRSKLPPPSHSLSRPSLDVNRIRHQSLDDIKDVECSRRVSDVGSLHGYKRMNLKEGSVNSLQQENQLDQDPRSSEKMELVKFAEALKASTISPKSRRRSASYSSF